MNVPEDDKELYPVNPDICSTCYYRHSNETHSAVKYTCDYITVTKHSRPKENSCYNYCEAYKEGNRPIRKELY